MSAIRNFGLQFHSEGLFTTDHPMAVFYQAIDAWGSEREVWEFLYSFIRLTKPKHCLETGSYKGYGSLYMAQALKDNGMGKLITIDSNQEIQSEAAALWRKHSLEEWIDPKIADSRAYEPPHPVDFAFLDCETTIRWEVLNHLKAGGWLKNSWVMIHDTRRDPLNKLIPQSDYKHFIFDTPRGLTLLKIEDCHGRDA